MSLHMKRVLCFALVIIVSCLFMDRLMAQPLPDGYGRTGEIYIIGRDGIRENMTRRWIGR